MNDAIEHYLLRREKEALIKTLSKKPEAEIKRETASLPGSQALKEVAQTIKKVFAKSCYGVAYGGDEFVIVLPGF